MDFDELLNRRERLLSAEDYADIECSDCIGCEKCCCRDLTERVTLDAFDIKLLSKGLGKSFDELVNDGQIEIVEVNAVPVPAFANKAEKGECVFLSGEGRCTVHPYRAGICRMYPLARLWQENGNFAYYLQQDECTHRTVKSTKVSDWLGYGDYKAYEQAVKKYHAELKEYRIEYYREADPEKKRKITEDFFDRNFRK